MKSGKIEVAPYDPNWEKLFEAGSEKLTKIFGKNFVKSHHIGSTSAPELSAKPIIYILVELKDLT
jgi:GrpB-like predicted nucleotidyltransferase (UPF0157 family)